MFRNYSACNSNNKYEQQITVVDFQEIYWKFQSVIEVPYR